MTIRVTCSHCQATFLASEERLGQPVTCPKCGQSTSMPATLGEVARGPDVRLSEAPSSPPSVLFPSEAAGQDEAEHPKGRRRRRLIPFLLGAVGGLLVAALVFWPILRRTEPGPAEVADRPDAPRPIDPAERTARAFLDALVEQDAETIDRLSVLKDPPAIASFEDVQRDPVEDETIRGSFAPLADLNRRVASKYTYDPAIGRFQNANPLGVAADFMDEAETLKQENEANDIYGRIAGGTADEQLDAAVEFAEQFAKLTRVTLPRQELVPTYAQIVEDSDPPLPPEAEELALAFGDETETWQDLLGRPFFTIEADGPFVLDRAEVVATIRDRLASPGDPPRLLRMSLVRFRLDAIDTGWKVVSARRDDPDTPIDSSDPFRSPGLGQEP
ncbi:hypothetical protein AB1L88_07220 [Tautonia sp. JC769]|uniref:hypothetical protein n=1 Tax=Tautonia sp. JC769 TaxID=3232135 RepID=UPI0034580D9F